MARNWTREELFVAMNLYCRIPFGQFHSRNPTIIEIAGYLGRTPGSLAMKLSNLASLDAVHQARGVKGLAGASAKDRQIWAEFQDNWEESVIESERQLALFKGETEAPVVNESFGEEDQFGMANRRIKQGFFREAVLSAYGNRCCITGLPVTELLNASHIIPWQLDKQNRLNPRNGLCLDVLHDRAFDRGFITVLPDLTVQVSPLLQRERIPDSAKRFLFTGVGKQITTPHRFAPIPEFLEWHNQQVFRS